MGWLIFLGVAVWLLVSLWTAIEFQNIAHDKGYDEKQYFWLPFLFGIAGWAVVIALPDKKMNQTLETIAKNLIRLEEGRKSGPKEADAVPEKKQSAPAAAVKEAPKAPDRERSAPVTAAKATPPGAVTPLAGSDRETVVCPLCGEEQRAGRNLCWNCGVPFVGEDEQSETTT